MYRQGCSQIVYGNVYTVRSCPFLVKKWVNPFHEINLRDLKTSMQMEIVNGKTPEMVRKEIYAHI